MRIVSLFMLLMLVSPTDQLKSMFSASAHRPSSPERRTEEVTDIESYQDIFTRPAISFVKLGRALFHTGSIHEYWSVGVSSKGKSTKWNYVILNCINLEDLDRENLKLLPIHKNEDGSYVLFRNFSVNQWGTVLVTNTSTRVSLNPVNPTNPWDTVKAREAWAEIEHGATYTISEEDYDAWRSPFSYRDELLRWS